ncbi:hypothetical protein [[Mycoplasma] gypis]|uniref:Uncharacterized protein n=1 Tax=[Mycoplasma] gypis TaxID=92404 RepID=A0ABZ2RTY1_9BACT|nr:hypothetical protein [[Mycoplasma] gypis]MBN0919397.1 hypothetical protein [[Mycoplasma] gypis]
MKELQRMNKETVDYIENLNKQEYKTVLGLFTFLKNLGIDDKNYVQFQEANLKNPNYNFYLFIKCNEYINNQKKFNEEIYNGQLWEYLEFKNAIYSGAQLKEVVEQDVFEKSFEAENRFLFAKIVKDKNFIDENYYQITKKGKSYSEIGTFQDLFWILLKEDRSKLEKILDIALREVEKIATEKLE